MGWVASWLASAQGPYPCGNDTFQPDLSAAFPDPSRGTQNQTFRLVLRPSVCGTKFRFRFSNVWGSGDLAIHRPCFALRAGDACLRQATTRPITFDGQHGVVIPRGEDCWSDPVDLAGSPRTGDDFVVSFYIPEISGPMTWHAKALTTSYITGPDSGCLSHHEGQEGFRFSTTSWFFLDAIETFFSGDACAIVALGDSLTEGTGSTLNGHDRWTDVLARNLARKQSSPVSVVNAGLGGNQIIRPHEYSVSSPFPGGPSGSSRLNRDVLGLASVSVLIWTEGINDFSRNGNAEVEEVRQTFERSVAYLRSQKSHLKILAGTLPPALGSSHPAHGSHEEDAKRQAWNSILRSGALFDGYIDFDAALVDPSTGRLRPEFVPSSMGGPGDWLHPNRLGYMTMAKVAEQHLMRFL